MRPLKVFVYFNLHKKVWSVKALNGPFKGLVIAHRDHVTLTDCTFKVSAAGRARVLRDKRKNVHAGVVGYIGQEHPQVEVSVPATYNPYKYATFVNKLDTAQELDRAAMVTLDANTRQVIANY